MLDLHPGVNIVQGANGLGKTNLVEAVEVISTGSSHRTSSSIPLVQRGATSATIRMNVEADDNNAADLASAQSASSNTTTLEATITARGANRGRINGGASRYMRDIVGRVPSVSFTPEDQQLVSGDPAVRRAFLNQTATQLIAGYADRLQTFTHIAKQRAALLKQLNQQRQAGQNADATLSGLEIWTGQFIEAGIAITRDRAKVIDRLAGPFAQLCAQLAAAADDASDGDRASDDAGSPAIAGLKYQPSFEEVLGAEDPAALISEHFRRIYPGEVARGINLIGPQRDDMTLTLYGMPAREFASNGETWTLALALKMAVYGALSETFGRKPIVILDDVFAQLDESRRAQILRFAAAQDQVLITVAADGDIPSSPIIAEGRTHRIDVAALKRDMQAQETADHA
ncbi:DNA recombination protein RecF [Bifidobacterium goeldii]|uniref:DNA replication and repair protein RecF n=1 Tax=Bifidobacterium goeldii TaxID=2306975 RepID=A0A430FH75_9BIFI|nr:DNA recombination protein RecF [Bifidobacterium goeldii]